jgi:hypothetical protein
MLSEMSVTKDITVSFYLYEMPRIVKFLQTESRMMVSRGKEEGKMESYCLVIRSFSFAR